MPSDESRVCRIGYADDQFLHGPPAALAALWPRLVNCLAEGGHDVQQQKCHVWCPACDDPQSVPDPHVDILAGYMQKDTGGVLLLGTTSRGEYGIQVGQGGAAVDEPVNRRAAACAKACEKLLDMLACPIQIPLTQVVWTLVHKAVNHALDYDMRLTPRAHAANALAVHDHAVGSVLSALVGNDGGQRMRDVLALPGPWVGAW